MAGSGGSISGLAWEPWVPLGPKLAFHCACVINDYLYLHGGMTAKDSTQPSNKMYRLGLQEGIWGEVKTPGSPSLSHHAAVVLSDRYILLVGGWTGKTRCGRLHVYDTEKDTWHEPQQRGFPEGAGLSSHTATLLANGDIMILGREGSLRIQRRVGNAYLLRGSVESGFVYSEYSREITSRSGHTTCVVGSAMYVIGGRSDRLLELQGGFSQIAKTKVSSLQKLARRSQGVTAMSKLPCGRKHHIAMSGADSIFIHGGDTFDGRSREPVGEMFLVSVKPTVQFYTLGDSSVRRAGHVCFTDGDSIFVHGGLTGRTSAVCGDIQKLSI